MRTKKKKISETGESPIPVQGPVNGASIEESEKKTDRISFFVSDKGLPEWDRMHGATREQLIGILTNPDVREKLGLGKEGTKEIEEIGFSEDEANALLDFFQGVNSLLAARIYKMPREITNEAFKYTEEHRRKLNPPMVRLMNKWGPSIIKTWKDEIGFAILLFSVTNAQLTVMRLLEQKRQRNLSWANVTPIVPPAQSQKKEEEPLPSPVEHLNTSAD
jgi:hypothetical protein